MPIVAEGDEEPNDTFREQLIASAEAAVKVSGAGALRRQHLQTLADCECRGVFFQQAIAV